MTAAGTQRELARYELPHGTRAVVPQRIDGRVAVSDIPVDDTRGRVYLIERHVHSQAELDGLVAAYVEHSQQGRLPRPSSPSAGSSTNSLTAPPDPSAPHPARRHGTAPGPTTRAERRHLGCPSAPA